MPHVLYREKVSPVSSLAVFLQNDKVFAGSIVVCLGHTQVEKSRNYGFSSPFPRIHMSSLNWQQTEEGTHQQFKSCICKKILTSDPTWLLIAYTSFSKSCVPLYESFNHWNFRFFPSSLLSADADFVIL